MSIYINLNVLLVLYVENYKGRYLPFWQVSRTEKASRIAFMAASLHSNLISEPE
jgi:hypothetical protein